MSISSANWQKSKSITSLGWFLVLICNGKKGIAGDVAIEGWEQIPAAHHNNTGLIRRFILLGDCRDNPRKTRNPQKKPINCAFSGYVLGAFSSAGFLSTLLDPKHFALVRDRKHFPLALSSILLLGTCVCDIWLPQQDGERRKQCQNSLCLS